MIEWLNGSYMPSIELDAAVSFSSLSLVDNLKWLIWFIYQPHISSVTIFFFLLSIYYGQGILGQRFPHFSRPSSLLGGTTLIFKHHVLDSRAQSLPLWDMHSKIWCKTILTRFIRDRQPKKSYGFTIPISPLKLKLKLLSTMGKIPSACIVHRHNTPHRSDFSLNLWNCYCN